ncbi:MAG: hypothetical protein N2171_06515 [Clostridia bacterium]|nr:hypothetical protein [Clostridia bacterium]
MYRQYYSYNDMPSMPDNTALKEKRDEAKPPIPVHNANNDLIPNSFFKDGKFLGRFELDDILLLVIILILLMDECDDNLLILSLAFVFLSGII